MSPSADKLKLIGCRVYRGAYQGVLVECLVFPDECLVCQGEFQRHRFVFARLLGQGCLAQ